MLQKQQQQQRRPKSAAHPSHDNNSLSKQRFMLQWNCNNYIEILSFFFLFIFLFQKIIIILCVIKPQYKPYTMPINRRLQRRQFDIKLGKMCVWVTITVQWALLFYPFSTFAASNYHYFFVIWANSVAYIIIRFKKWESLIKSNCHHNNSKQIVMMYNVTSESEKLNLLKIISKNGKT